MDFSSFDDKFFQDLNVDLGPLVGSEDPFANISEMNFTDFLSADTLREFSDAVSSPPFASQVPDQPTCYDDFESVEASFSPPSNPPSFRSMSSKISEPASPPAPPATRLRPSAVAQRAGSAMSSAPKLHPSTYAPSPALSDTRGPTPIGVRGCPKRHRKTIQLKRQEQQSRLDTLNTRHTKLQEAVRVAANEVSAARQTLYTVLKTARMGHLEAFSPAP
eukprot:m.17952 g.17952  ORF g.17952 m.17952 type:complete len:219 (+) comp7249_c0_seq1:149-805(+)